MYLSYWNFLACALFQMLQMLLSLAFTVCFIYRFILVADTVEQLRATYHESYVDVSPIAKWDQVNILPFPCCCFFIFWIVTLYTRYVHNFMGYNSWPFHLSYIHVGVTFGLNKIHKRKGMCTLCRLKQNENIYNVHIKQNQLFVAK